MVVVGLRHPTPDQHYHNSFTPHIANMISVTVHVVVGSSDFETEKHSHSLVSLSVTGGSGRRVGYVSLAIFLTANLAPPFPRPKLLHQFSSKPTVRDNDWL